MRCVCTETSALRELALPLPDHHDCLYVTRRDALVGQAIREVNQEVGRPLTDAKTSPLVWSWGYRAVMERLVYEHYRAGTL